jgi:hypothetical protein
LRFDVTVKQITEITDHAEQGIARLRQLYKDATPKYTVAWKGDLATGWEAMLYAFIKPAQTLETILNKMLNERGLTTAEGVNLDRIGQIVGADRGGQTDQQYLGLISAQIAANNSDTTAEDLLNITRILLEDVLELTAIREEFPASAVLDFQISIKYTIDATNDLIGFEADYGVSGEVQATLTHGDYYPYELAQMLEDEFNTAMSQVLNVSFNGDTSFLVFLDEVPVLAAPAIYWNTAGPVWGFPVSGLTFHNKSGSPIGGPDYLPSSIKETLDSAKAAGVLLTPKQVSYLNYFGFEEDTGSLPFAVIQGWEAITYYDNWVTPASATSATYLIQGVNGTGMKFFMDQTNGPLLKTEMEAYLVGSSGIGRYFTLRDANRDQFEFEITASDVVITGANVSDYYELTIEIKSGGVSKANVTRDRFESIDIDDLGTEFGDFLAAELSEFDYENPEGIGKTVRDLLSGGGQYSMLIV